ncbi:PEP-CTERM sorting domain-containing protein [Rubripirellula amarantea]|nr:PEP-CTERM sorting domain-containing protein [Rubripirellula amarantea]
MSSRSIHFLAAIVVLLFSVSPLYAEIVTGLGNLAGAEGGSMMTAMSSDGRVVTGFAVMESAPRNIAAFAHTDETGMQRISTPPVISNIRNMSGTAVSSDGEMIALEFGQVGVSQPVSNGAFSVDGSRAHHIPPNPSNGVGLSKATGISGDKSTIVGQSHGSSQAKAAYYIFGEGTREIEDAPANSFAKGISESGEVVFGATGSKQGFSYSATDGYRRFSSLGDGNNETVLNAIDSEGRTIVGYSKDDLGFRHAVHYSETGIPKKLSKPTDGVLSSEALAVSGDGSMTVGFANFFGIKSAFIYSDSLGFKELGEYITLRAGEHALGDWELTEARGISYDGSVISGNGINPLGQREPFKIRLDSTVAVPEPSTSLVIAAICAFCVTRRLKRRHQRSPSPCLRIRGLSVVCKSLVRLGLLTLLATSLASFGQVVYADVVYGWSGEISPGTNDPLNIQNARTFSISVGLEETAYDVTPEAETARFHPKLRDVVLTIGGEGAADSQAASLFFLDGPSNDSIIFNGTFSLNGTVMHFDSAIHPIGNPSEPILELQLDRERPPIVNDFEAMGETNGRDYFALVDGIQFSTRVTAVPEPSSLIAVTILMAVFVARRNAVQRKALQR